MNIFSRIFNYKRKSDSQQVGKTKGFISDNSFENSLTWDSDFLNLYTDKPLISYYLHAWVNIAIQILIRNIARADFTIKRGGDDVTHGQVYDLFNRPNSSLSKFDFWKELAAWWFLEGEAFIWFGEEYGGGLPKELFILDPRKMHHEGELFSGIEINYKNKPRRWFYHSGAEIIPILSDELVHFRDWNPYNPVRGVSPLLSLSLELEQDYYANKSNSILLKNNAVPQGILKTEQTLRPEEADQLERRWESKYGNTKGGRKIAVLGKGTEFKPVTFSPDVVKLYELKKWNLYTILAKYGIPPRVANINDKTTALSGKDTSEQHSAFWKFTLIPTLRQFENILETQFFIRFSLKEKGVFDLWDVPELQENEDQQSRRDIAEINAGLKTINDVLKERGKKPKPWGDTWYRPKNFVATNGKGNSNESEGAE